MTNPEHVSIPWLEGKVSDQLDELYGILEQIEERMQEFENRQEQIIEHFQKNINADVLNKLVDKYNGLVDFVQKLATPKPPPTEFTDMWFELFNNTVAAKPAKRSFKPKIVRNDDPDEPPPAA